MPVTNTSIVVDAAAPPGDPPARIPERIFDIWSRVPGELNRLVTERAKAEDECAAIYGARKRRADATFKEALATAKSQHQTEAAETADTLTKARSKALAEFQAESSEIENQHQKSRKAAVVRYRREVESAEKAWQSARWEATTLYETADKGANEWRFESKKLLASESQLIKTLREETTAALKRYRGFLKGVDHAVEPPIIEEYDDPFPLLRESIEQADAASIRLEHLFIPSAFRGFRILWLFVLFAAIMAYPAYRFLGATNGAIACAIVSIGLVLAVRPAIMKAGRKQIDSERIPLLKTLARGEALAAKSEGYIVDTHRRRIEEATERRDSESRKADKTRDRIASQSEETRASKVREADELATSRRREITERRDLLVRDAEASAKARREAIDIQLAEETRAAETKHQSETQEAENRRRADWDRLANAWRDGISGLSADVSKIRGEADRRFPDWSRLESPEWSQPTDLPPVIRIGESRLGLDLIPDGISRDASLRAMSPDEFRIPALLDFPDQASVIVEAQNEEGRRRAIDVMQGVMLRFLTGLPAGKVRFTIIDPVGLGRNFAGFMHLGDYSEALVNTRIWTEPQQIDQRIAELNVHIETVIQRYLRNEFATIEQYNVQAAEVAEPYRVLVVADFPAGFSEATAKRLAAIAKSGPRCGVYLVLGRDMSVPLPPNCEKKDLELHAVRIVWKDGRFLLKNPAYESFPLAFDVPPEGDHFSKILRNAGAAAKAANKVEVPFDVIAPKPEDMWTGDSRSGIHVPLGRSGATKFQAIDLGKGTAQHVLIAGRTGSGKSTLLHALITNAALIYSPDEVELYLIDFKKGVEFKTYATYKLPHARVVAIESEREFGLSVLQRLDVELKRRGDIYRDLGVQDVAGYRNATGKFMPRVLLIVDEFQEFFVEDDKLAQESSLLLDRLVRQGRAFGVHVHLGSQTLGGAYSLARSTLGQMAVRIALQCSEADAQLILTEDNSAARELSRPGEAIYNDANGQSEGNHIFQVVFLTDTRRDFYLKKIAELARERNVTAPPAIVFEGNKPADLATHPALVKVGSAEPVPSSKTVYAWLGDAVAIKDPTAATFRSQGGSHLLVIGQNDEMAVGIFFASILGLAAQLPKEAKLYLLDGTPDDSSFHGTLAKLVDLVPQTLRYGSLRDAGVIMTEVAAEVNQRQSGGESSAAFLFIYDLPRFRDLRKSDDDFSFGRKSEEKPVNAGKLLGNVLREGSALGVHIIAWCDSLNNTNRAFDRGALREFEMRVLFQMSPGDSSNLIDSPAASKLGANRALFSSEEQGRQEKFRPYGLPTQEWLEALRDKWKN